MRGEKMIEIKVEKGSVTVQGCGMTVDVAVEAMTAMVAALRQIRDIDKEAYKTTCAWIKAGGLIGKVEDDD
jgi:riboflavin synthase alpha subunit